MPHTGAMIAAKLRDEDAVRLAVENGEPVDELHLTLLFLGEAAAIPEDARERILDAVVAIAEKMNVVEAEAFAVSVFNPPGVTRADDMDRDTCVTALVSDPTGDLVTLRGAVEEIFLDEALGFEPPEQHSPWQPHVTLAYIETTDVAPYVDRVGPLVVDGIRVAFGGDVYDIPLGDDEISQVESHSETLLSDVDVDDFGEIIVPNVLLDLRGDVDSFQRERDLSAPGPGGHNLRNYWVRGKGAAKIRWGTKGSMRRCIRQLRKYVRDPGGLCAEYHKRATGEWPRGGLIPSMLTMEWQDQARVVDVQEQNGEVTARLRVVPPDEEATIIAGGDSWRHQVRAPRGTPIGGQWVDEVNGEISWKWTRGGDIRSASELNGQHTNGEVVAVRSDNNAFMRWNAERDGYDISKRRGLGESWDFEQISREDARDRVLGETGEEWFEPKVEPLAEDDDGLDGLVESVDAPTKPESEPEPESGPASTPTFVSPNGNFPEAGAGARFSGSAFPIQDMLQRSGYTPNQVERAQAVNDLFAERYGASFSLVASMNELRSVSSDVPDGAVAAVVPSTDGESILIVEGNITDDVIQRVHDHGAFTASNLEGALTHEIAHALLVHPDTGMIYPRERTDARARVTQALDAARTAALAAGMPEGHVGHDVSTYGNSSRTEGEAEMFTAYHWGGPSRPEWVTAWGEAFHHNLGLDPTPFSSDA